jgi:hypothetical protein
MKVLVSWPYGRLWVAGEGPHRAALAAQINRLGLSSRVLLAGVFQQVDDLLAAADLFILPSYEEGMSLALLEAMAAGLPITARRNHAYAVQYYSPQGTDATIYPGSADLKFVNNTPGAILIWPYKKDKNTLVYDFYGTSDGRKVTLEKPVVYDRKSDGSMKATWTREIFNNGNTTIDTFKSVYQSPALFHKTETFVSSTGTPVSGLKIPPVKTQ